MGGNGAPSGPDLTKGVPETDVADGGMLAGRVGDEAVLVARRGDDFYAIGATCTHYGGPLAEGLVVGDTVRCPWHHACFSLKTGEALGAPALDHVSCWTVERRDGKVFVRDRQEDPVPSRSPGVSPESILILGAGAAGHAAAEMLRREGYDGPVTVIDQDDDEPYDKPNLSKDYLAGDAEEEWIPLRDPAFFAERDIERVLGRSARAIDIEAKAVTLDDGTVKKYDRLLLATGARPRELPVKVDPESPLHYLRTLTDSRAIIGAANSGDRAVVIGASFIGLEVAASLRARDVEVHVVAPEEVLLARVMGDELGRFIRTLHEENGVHFHLGTGVEEVTAEAVLLDGGQRLEADFVVAGIGVIPRDEIARAAGLTVDNGIVVNATLETSAPGVYAAGDVARFPDPRTKQPIRVEHWVVAQRMGQHAARSMLGADAPFTDVPFFWSQHYDTVIAYVGHAPDWDDVEVDGKPADRDCAVRFTKDGTVLALATIFRDEESLRFEAELEG